MKDIVIENIWGSNKRLEWKSIHEDVNILVGVNGSGKSTLLNILWKTLRKSSLPSFTDLLSRHTFLPTDSIPEKHLFSEIRITDITGKTFITQETFSQEKLSFKCDFISTFDIPTISTLSKGDTPLDKELSNTIYTTGKNSRSFFDYRLKSSNYPEQATRINQRLQHFYRLINTQFSSTKKTIQINPDTNKLEFRTDEAVIQLEQLSSGEKQYLLILFKAFLQEEEPTLLLMDEPEISLDIDWQYRLLDVIRELNPQCQIIISTHSPGIFGNGWGDKVVYMEDILTL